MTSAKDDPEGFNEFLKELLTDYINSGDVSEKNITLNKNKHNNKNKKKCNC